MSLTLNNPTAQIATAYLVVEQDGTRRAGLLTDRVLIGRRVSNQIVIPDRTVSRIHAWISHGMQGHYVADTGSRTGTRVNGDKLEGRQTLRDGDVIGIGPVRITYHTEAAAAAHLEPLDLSRRPIEARSLDDGLFMDCRCGAPLWVPWDFAGRMGQCRYCGQAVVVRDTDEAHHSVLTPAPAPHRSETGLSCGICQTDITAFEDTTVCPSCGLTFHADCWTENRGCSAYGCSHVNALEPAENGNGHAAAVPDDATLLAEAGHHVQPFPWEFICLAASVAALLVGALTFGVPSLLAVAIEGWYLARGGARRRQLVLLSITLAAAGCLAGAALSWYWWFGWKHTK